MTERTEALGAGRGYGPSPAPAPPPDPARPSPRNAASIVALLTGVLAVPGALALLPGVALGGLAIVLGVVGRRRAAAGESTAGGAALGGIVSGTVAVVASVAWAATIVVWEGNAQDRYEECLRSGEVPRVCAERYDPASP